MKRVVLAMSGGVDSSVAAHLLQKQGYEVIGLFMRSGVDPIENQQTGDCEVLPVLRTEQPVKSNKQGCCSATDAADARRVADRLDIPFYALDFHDQFDRIMDYFADEYLSGRTPTPCVVCNNWLKFGKLWEYAQQVGADFIATGHYARLQFSQQRNKEYQLLRARDHDKDQSYVLFGIPRTLLKRILFPMGEYRKPEIREMASSLNLPVATKPDSQEICFVQSGSYADFVRQRRSMDGRKGEIVDTEGRCLGYHDGIENFTVGQRKGIRIALGVPNYVTEIDSEKNRVVIGKREDLARKKIALHRVSWLDQPVHDSCELDVQIRYRHVAAPAIVTTERDGHADVLFEQSQFGVAPGQAAVFYDGDQVVGGGWIR